MYHDHRGNSFNPNQDQLLLFKAGWRVVDIRRRGMIRAVIWLDPKSESNACYNQTTAVLMQKQRTLSKK